MRGGITSKLESGVEVGQLALMILLIFIRSFLEPLFLTLNSHEISDRITDGWIHVILVELKCEKTNLFFFFFSCELFSLEITIFFVL